MKSILGKFLLVLLLVLPSTLMLAGSGGSPGVVYAAEDADTVEGEEEDVAVEDEEVDVEDTADTDSETVTTGEQTEEEEEEEEQLKPSPDAETQLLFVKPTRATDFPAASLIRLVVGFSNKGSKNDFTVESMDAALRYPQDYSFYIYNFTTVRFNRVVEPSREATFEYAFTPHEQFQGRPFGLTINVNYRDSEENRYQDAVFNETITIAEPDEGLDGETFFLYVVLAALVVLLLVGAQQLLKSFSRRRLSKPKQAVEMGTQNNTGVDYDWIPKETLNSEMNKSPRRTPKTSPRERRKKRASGSGDE